VRGSCSQGMTDAEGAVLHESAAEEDRKESASVSPARSLTATGDSPLKKRNSYLTAGVRYGTLASRAQGGEKGANARRRSATAANAEPESTRRRSRCATDQGHYSSCFSVFRVTLVTKLAKYFAQSHKFTT
jgi:hypothetical protein